jgi:D-alanine transaminase
MPDPRWRYPDIKSTSLVATVTGKLASAEAGADEILFLGTDDEVREGGTSNFFARRGDVLETHPLDGRILPGVTRKLVLRLAAEATSRLGLRVTERAPRLAERADWSEAFLTGTLTGLQPVTHLDGEPVGDGTAGPWVRALGKALDELEERCARDHGEARRP